MMPDITLSGDTKLPIRAVYVLVGVVVAIAIQWMALNSKADSVKDELAPMRSDVADMKSILKSIDERMRTDVLRFEGRITALEVEIRALKK